MEERIPAIVSGQVVRRLGVPRGRRTERIVHTLDGIEKSVLPGQVIASCENLWRIYSDSDSSKAVVDYLLGLDAGGIIPTIGISLVSGLSYRLAWKLKLDLPSRIRFSEPFASRKSIYAYGLKKGDKVLLVDDEITTGQTLRGCVRKLHESGIQINGILCLIEDLRFGARDLITAEGVNLFSLATIS